MVWEFSKFQEKTGRYNQAFKLLLKKSLKLFKNKLYVLKLVFTASFHNLQFPYVFINVHIYDFSENGDVWSGF